MFAKHYKNWMLNVSIVNDIHNKKMVGMVLSS